MYVLIDGPDGAGKTTMAAKLATYLTEMTGRETLLVREPGSTEVGEALRKVILETDGMSNIAEFFLFSAARAELMSTVVAPAIDRGDNVVMDRGWPSSFVYQFMVRNHPITSLVYNATQIALCGVVPDRIAIMVATPDRCRARLAHRGTQSSRFERFDMESVCRAFLQVSSMYCDGHLIDANGSQEDVFLLIKNYIGFENCLL